MHTKVVGLGKHVIVSPINTMYVGAREIYKDMTFYIVQRKEISMSRNCIKLSKFVCFLLLARSSS